MISSFCFPVLENEQGYIKSYRLKPNTPLHGDVGLPIGPDRSIWLEPGLCGDKNVVHRGHRRCKHALGRS